MASMDSSKEKTDVVLLCCGSFNPITYLHLCMFELARDYLHQSGRYRVLEGIISPVDDGYAKKGLISAKHRNAMVSLALESSDWVRLDTWESDQGVWTSTEKVIEHHKETLNSPCSSTSLPGSSSTRQHNPPQLFFLCGADLLETFLKPELWTEQEIENIVGQNGIICKTRQGCDAQDVIQASSVLRKYTDNLHIVEEWVLNDVSSTKIRAALARGDSVRYLVPDSVIAYIHRHRLYGVNGTRG